MNSTRITDHVERAKARLIDQYKGKPGVEGLVEALMGPIQDVEDALFAIGRGGGHTTSRSRAKRP